VLILCCLAFLFYGCLDLDFRSRFKSPSSCNFSICNFHDWTGRILSKYKYCGVVYPYMSNIHCQYPTRTSRPCSTLLFRFYLPLLSHGSFSLVYLEHGDTSRICIHTIVISNSSATLLSAGEVLTIPLSVLSDTLTGNNRGSNTISFEKHWHVLLMLSLSYLLFIDWQKLTEPKKREDLPLLETKHVENLKDNILWIRILPRQSR